MSNVQEKVSYILALSGKAQEFSGSIAKLDQRAQALDEIMGSGLSDKERKKLHDLFDFQINTKKMGRFDKPLESHEMDLRKGIESEDVKDYQSISRKDMEDADQAMQKVLQMRDRLLNKTGPDGKPLFTPEEVAVEIFTPLMREGIMPETLIPDKYSETAKMLEETFKLYKKTIESKETKAQEKMSEMEFKASGGDTTKSQVGALAKKRFLKFKDSMDQKVQGKLERVGITTSTKQERQRMIKIGMKALKVAKLGKKTVTMIQGLPTEISDALDQLGQQTAGYEFMKGNTEGVEAIAQQQELAKAASQNPADIVFLGNITNSIESILGPEATPEAMKIFTESFDEELNNLAEPIRKEMASDTAVFTRTMIMLSAKVLTKNGTAIGKLVKNISDLQKFEETLKKAVQDGALRTELQLAAVDVAEAIENRIVESISTSNALVGTAYSGLIADKIEAEDWADIALEEERKDRSPTKIIDSIVDAVLKVLPKPITTELASVFRSAAESFQSEFTKQATVVDIANDLEERNPKTIFKLLIPAAEKASSVAFANPKFIEVLKSESTNKAIKTKEGQENESLVDDYEESQEELREFEKDLILVDEGGVDIAKQKRIEVLIADLQRDRKILEIVESCGNLLRTLGRTVPGLGVAINNEVVERTVTDTITEVGKQTFAEEVGGQVTAALNAARLIIQLSVNAIRAAERWSIWYRFRDDVEKAYRARSFLLPAIESFLNNKKEQIAYHTIEDAMLAIQLAGSITSTVPEPITLAVGKSLTTIGKLGQASNKLGKAIFDEVTIRTAWKRTLEAIGNPKNRKAGLQAIHDNILLAAHSVAWAATKGDPIAEQILRGCKVDAQSLADDETDAKKIVEYLMLYLSDTGKGEVKFESALSDPEKISTSWRPPKIELTLASWFSAKNRAVTLAKPPLRDLVTKEIDNAFKLVQVQPTIESMKSDVWKLEKKVLESHMEEVRQLISTLKAYKPKLGDNSDHVEMKSLRDEYLTKAEDRLIQLQEVSKILEKLPWKRAEPSIK